MAQDLDLIPVQYDSTIDKMDTKTCRASSISAVEDVVPRPDDDDDENDDGENKTNAHSNSKSPLPIAFAI